MYRRSGLVALGIGAVLVYSLVFTTFNQPTRSWHFTEDGGIERAKVACPTPWQVLIEELEPTENPWKWGYCIRSSRTLFSEGVVVAAIALWAGIWGISQGPRPPRKPLRPLSEILKIPTG